MNLNSSFNDFATQARAFVTRTAAAVSGPQTENDAQFNRLALELFSLQFHSVPIYREFCTSRRVWPDSVEHWSAIPALPAVAFKEYEVSSLAAGQRTRVFHSSGTSGQRRGRHFHDAQSLGLYEASLWPWFARHFIGAAVSLDLIFLTPSAALAPDSSLAHMFDSVRRQLEGSAQFAGRVDTDGSWTLDMERTAKALSQCVSVQRPVALLGPAFSFVHFLEYCQSQQLRFGLPKGSRALETGGYKGRSRAVSKTRLHQWIGEVLEIPQNHIVTEYGMSELSSQAYDRIAGAQGEQADALAGGLFRFPPWAQTQIVSPETGAQVQEGQTGLVRVFDLANIRSVMAIETQDLGVRRREGFELIGRAAVAEPRGCSLALREF
jgi:hypothetical protein